MLKLEVLDRQFHQNQGSVPFVASIIDDPNDGDTKLVIMFEDSGYTAVLSLNRLIDEEDISAKNNKHNAAGVEEQLRDLLWENT